MEPNSGAVRSFDDTIRGRFVSIVSNVDHSAIMLDNS
jgi:hypothetical protein